MRFADKKKEQRESFLWRFDQTAKAAFPTTKLSSSKYNWEKEPSRTLIELARTSLGYANQTPARVIYRDLVHVWRRIRKRKTAWNGNIDLAPADIEDY